MENHPPHSQNASAAADFASNGIGGSEVVIDDDDDEDILVAGGADVSGSSQRSSFKMRVSSFFRLWSTQDEEKKLRYGKIKYHSKDDRSSKSQLPASASLARRKLGSTLLLTFVVSVTCRKVRGQYGEGTLSYFALQVADAAISHIDLKRGLP